MAKTAIGIDLGGTRIKAVVLDEWGRMLKQEYIPTQDTDDGIWKQTILHTIKNLQTELNLIGFVVGISAPGIPNEQNSAKWKEAKAF